ncbi:nitrile hydratase accessory protein [Paraburkholderia caribensis]|uniref:nitrile hydratase accessory protein n=1 Tax=Paraburkholderia TaxID=1822464 RepID=UPI001CB2E108|nr:nitrile hydratase accessory protein [Paraburkholderia caribensis]BEU25608.1 nitrile hydratase accessory protein [Paraburkholderia sp. 22B1P]CAG9262542.1 Putative transmembrane nitrile hydratase [Paraburkholderia caribensis]
MDATSTREKLGLLNSGMSAPPMVCDSLQFEEPWQSRLFGLALALSEAGTYPWESFRQSLISTIGAWEKGHALDDPTWRYYEQYLGAFEKLVTDLGLVDPDTLDKRTEEFRLRTRKEVI